MRSRDDAREPGPELPRAHARRRAARVGGVEVLDLPYDGGEPSMLVLVPPLARAIVFLGRVVRP